MERAAEDGTRQEVLSLRFRQLHQIGKIIELAPQLGLSPAHQASIGLVMDQLGEQHQVVLEFRGIPRRLGDHDRPARRAVAPVRGFGRGLQAFDRLDIGAIQLEHGRHRPGPPVGLGRDVGEPDDDMDRPLGPLDGELVFTARRGKDDAGTVPVGQLVQLHEGTPDCSIYAGLRVADRVIQ